MSILKNKFVKILLIILLTILLVAFGVLLYINHNINGIINDKINEKYNGSVMSEYYDLSFEKLKVNVLTGNLKLINLKLTHKIDTNTKFFTENGSIDFEINKLILRGVNIYSFIKTDSLNVNKILIRKPTITINKGTSILKPYNFSEKNNTDTVKILFSLKALSLQDAILNYKEEGNNITVNDLDITSKNISITSNVFIESFNIKVNDVSQISKSVENINNFSFNNLNINVNKFNINPTKDTTIYSYSDFIIKINKPKFNTKDSLYTFKTRSIAIDYKNRDIKIENLILTPNYSRKQFSKKFKYQTERYFVDIKSLIINDIDLYHLFAEPHIYADNININNVVADIYRDKTYPLNRNKYPLFPAQQIQQIKIPIDVKSINVKNANITYSEKISAKKTGKVDISNLALMIKDVSNINNTETLKITAEGKVRNKIPFIINVNLNYNKPQFTFNGTVYKSNLKNANKILSSFEPIELKKGNLNKLTFNGFANNTSSKGEMLFLYNNVNIKILDKNKKASTKVKNKVTSLVANTVIHKNNPAKGKKAPRTVSFGYKRDKNKSFINYIWKSLFNGIIETIHPSKENQKKYKNELKKQRRKEHARK